MHVSTNSNFVNSYLASMNSHGFSLNDLDIIPSDFGMLVSNGNKPKHSRKQSGGAATPMLFHPSISAKTDKVLAAENDDGGDTEESKWTSHMFKHKFNSSIRGIDGGPRIIRTASEATSDQSLSYKIPTGQPSLE